MIPSNLSPRCPQLSTLWLRENPCLECIPDSFFKQLHGLKVLDLSRTGIQRLPDSISDLVCLTALLLGGCHKLKHIPSLAKLRELMKLVVNETSLEEAPHGMDQLSTLRYLDIFSRKLELPAGMLPRLSNLELLRMGIGQVQEAANLSKLQSFECCFHGLMQFNEYLESQEESHELSLTEYCFVIVGQDNFVITSLDSPWRHPSLKRSSKAWIRDCNISMANFKALPKDIEKLTIERCFGVRSLSDVSPLQHANQLKTLKIWECAGIESLLSVSSFPLEILQSLKVLWLANLESLCTLIKIEGASPTLLPHEGTFSFLKHFKMSSFPSVKKLFHPCLLPRLSNLEKLEVEFCRMLEEIISVEENEAEEENEIRVMIEENNSIASSGQFSLPKLKILRLEGLPNLKSISKGSMACECIQKVYVCNCPKLKNIPLSYPLPSLQKIQVYPLEWWESVEWPHYPEAKNDLQPLCLFCY